MRPICMARATVVSTILLGFVTVARANEPYSRAVLEQKLEKEYPLTAVNAEGSVVTQGVVLVLKKSGLTAGVAKACTNDYKDGRISLGGNVLARAGCIKMMSDSVGTATRGFVTGERLSVAKIEIKDAVALTLISDPISDVRYRAELKFPFPKGTEPDFTQTERMITEVFGIAPPEVPAAQAPAQQGEGAAAGQPLPAIPEPPPPPPDPAATTPIAPPPPPPDQPTAPPQTLSLGLTIDQVVAILGQPATIADLGAKKIYSYKSPSMKMTFMNGKLTDMQ